MPKTMRETLPTLNQGDSGNAVALLQRLLILYGYTNLVGPVDGVFGPKTKEAVLQFQRDQNLATKDGIVAAVTWRQLTFPAGTQPPA
jgi:peptidoglycan hydrolase-like protein with peptidoglycan-binding domain